jgi:mRNA interferase MazF
MMTEDSILPPPDQLPPRVQPRIQAAPKIRQIYWCDFPRDAQLPEMWKVRPVVVVSYRNTLHGPCTVIPFSTASQGNSPWAWEMTNLDGRKSWAICNHPYTIAPSRFFQPGRIIPKVSEADFNEILQRLNAWLPRPFSLDKSG